MERKVEGNDGIPLSHLLARTAQLAVLFLPVGLLALPAIYLPFLRDLFYSVLRYAQRPSSRGAATSTPAQRPRAAGAAGARGAGQLRGAPPAAGRAACAALRRGAVRAR
jgi:hypothetical protein